MIYPFPAFQTLLLLLQMSAYVVNQPIKALCEILKITASKLIAAAVETLWQTIVRLANEIDFVNIAVSKHRVQR